MTDNLYTIYYIYIYILTYQLNVPNGGVTQTIAM